MVEERKLPGFLSPQYPAYAGLCVGIVRFGQVAPPDAAFFLTGKVKLLLKELWLCVNSARRLPGDGRRRAPGEGDALRTGQQTC